MKVEGAKTIQSETWTNRPSIDGLVEANFYRVPALLNADVFFKREAVPCTEEMAAYLNAYKDIAFKQLLRGHFASKSIFRSLKSREDQLDSFNFSFNGVRFNTHDLKHTVIALALSDDKESLESLTPLFHKVPPLATFLSTLVGLLHPLPGTNRSLLRQEVLVQLFEYSREELKEFQKTSSSALDFGMKLVPAPFNTLSRRVMASGRKTLEIFNYFYRANLDDQSVFSDFFIATTAPLMRKHAPEVAEKLLKSVTPRRSKQRG